MAKKPITFSVDGVLIIKARKQAALENRTLDHAFSEWLAEYSGKKSRVAKFDALLKRMRRFKTTRKISRDELNER